MRSTKTCLNVKTQRMRTPEAFTLLELITVLVLAALLALTLTPSLARTRPSSNASQCLNNLRQLAVAWRVYSEDYNGHLVPNPWGAAAGTSGSASWAGGWLDLTTASSDNTNVLFLIRPGPLGGSAALLGPYSRSVSLYKCPSDRSTMPGSSLPRVRSVSLNGRVGEVSTTWKTPTAYRLYKKSSSLISPTPSQHFIFLDEREDSINDPAFLTDPDTPWQIIDFPGAYHSGGGNFAFADGRAELHRWLDPRTVPPLNPGISLNLNFPNDPDVLWVQQHAASR